MNLRRLKISDVAKELQTDKFKLMIYKQIEKFVYKYHTHYYPHYKGELKDLIVDIFTKFCEPKKHRNGEVFSELDRVEPSKVGGGQWTGDEDKAIATYVQRYVIARLIDMERTDKREVNVSENFDEKNPGLTVDRALMGGKKRAGSGDDGMVEGGYVENINYRFYDLMDNPQAISNAKRTLLNNPEQVKRIKYLAKHYDDKLDPEVKEFITKLLGEEEEAYTEKTSEVEETIKSVLGDSVKVSKYYLQGKPAIKVSFTDKETMNSASEHKEQVIESLKEDGYEFYKAHGSNWYFFKVSKVGDSVQGPKNGQRFKCIKDVPNPSGYGLFCKEGDLVSCSEDDYLVNSEGQVYRPYKYSMQEYFELDEVDDSTIKDSEEWEDFADTTTGMKIIDATARERFESLMDRVGDNPQHYLNQINKCGKAPYEQGKRTKGQWKLKGRLTIDAFVTGAVPASEDKSLKDYIGGFKFSTNYKGKEIEIAAVSNIDMATRKAATVYDDQGKPQLNPEWLGKCAELVAQNFKEGSLRLGSARINEWRDDKTPEDCQLQDEMIRYDR